LYNGFVAIPQGFTLSQLLVAIGIVGGLSAFTWDRVGLAREMENRGVRLANSEQQILILQMQQNVQDMRLIMLETRLDELGIKQRAVLDKLGLNGLK
jgi:hypothetical protein